MTVTFDLETLFKDIANYFPENAFDKCKPENAKGEKIDVLTRPIMTLIIDIVHCTFFDHAKALCW